MYESATRILAFNNGDTYDYNKRKPEENGFLYPYYVKSFHFLLKQVK